MYGTILESLFTKEYNRSEFDLLVSPNKDQEAKEGLDQSLKEIIKETGTLMQFYAIKIHVWYHFGILIY